MILVLPQSEICASMYKTTYEARRQRTLAVISTGTTGSAWNGRYSMITKSRLQLWT